MKEAYSRLGYRQPLLVLALGAPLAAYSMCLPSTPDTIELLVTECAIAPLGDQRIMGKPRLIEAGRVSEATPSAEQSRSWDEIPEQRFAWQYGSHMGCESLEPGKVIVVYRHQKCCDVRTFDVETGEESWACDNEPWYISTGK